jgi:uncharacterized metal-binding protein YceD (DUF177 family)
MELVIYVDRLKEGQTETFSGDISSDFLGDDPSFQDNVKVSGQAYIAGDHLILKLQAETAAWLPCSICNQPTLVSSTLVDFYHAQPLEDVSSIFDFSSLLREDLLLQLPFFAECEGNCPERESLKKFLKTPSESSPDGSVFNVQFPFADL